MSGRKTFAVVGVGGFVAAGHLVANASVGGEVVAAHDVRDSVGILDRHFPDAAFFLDPAAFATFLAGGRGRLDYVSICSPSDLHEEHCRLACRLGADVICEKPLTLEAAGLDRLARLQQETGRAIHPVLQLRYHEQVPGLRAAVRAARARGRYVDVDATYITRRGPWYAVSWKGDAARSGGILFHLGVHVFDLVAMLFGPVSRAEAAEVTALAPDFATGALRDPGARVRWLLSPRAEGLPTHVRAAGRRALRTFAVDGEVVIDYSSNYGHLHPVMYGEIVQGRGHVLAAGRPGLELTDWIAREGARRTAVCSS